MTILDGLDMGQRLDREQYEKRLADAQDQAAAVLTRLRGP